MTTQSSSDSSSPLTPGAAPTEQHARVLDELAEGWASARWNPREIAACRAGSDAIRASAHRAAADTEQTGHSIDLGPDCACENCQLLRGLLNRIFDLTAALTAAEVRAADVFDDPEIQGSTGVPCCDCGRQHREYTIASDVWNAVTRPEGKETDREYLCLGCFVNRLRSKLTAADARLATLDWCHEKCEAEVLRYHEREDKWRDEKAAFIARLATTEQEREQSERLRANAHRRIARLTRLLAEARVASPASKHEDEDLGS